MFEPIIYRQYIEAIDDTHYWGFVSEGQYIAPWGNGEEYIPSFRRTGHKDNDDNDIYVGDVIETTRFIDGTDGIKKRVEQYFLYEAESSVKGKLMPIAEHHSMDDMVLERILRPYGVHPNDIKVKIVGDINETVLQ